MSNVVRFTVSLEEELLQRFDTYCRQRRLATRSEAVRQMIHERLMSEAWESGQHEVAGTLTLVYNHHHAQVSKRLAKLQHDNHELIVSTTHVHLTHDVCLEVVILRGSAQRLQQIAFQLKGMKGVFKGELVLASAHGE